MNSSLRRVFSSVTTTRFLTGKVDSVRGIKDVTSVGAVIADDAHVAFSAVRDAFTLRVEKAKNPNLYATLTNMFRNDLAAVGRAGTFDDIIVAGTEAAVLEVPHWSWLIRTPEVREILRPNAEQDYTFVWPLAQRIEQGIGRGARGSGDYCVVLLIGPDLNAWVGRASNLPLLTSSPRSQLDMGFETSKHVQDAGELFDTTRKCLDRSDGWPEYHASRLAQPQMQGRQGSAFSSVAQPRWVRNRR